MIYRNIKTGIEFSTNCAIKSDDCVEVKAPAQVSDTTEAPKVEKKPPTPKGKKK